jgi:alpha-amylase
MEREIILHCFMWKLRDITKELENIKNSGYTAIQITPIQPCKDGSEFWTYYQPLAFAIGNKTGTKEDLKELCNKAKELNIKIIADVVLRHTAGVNSGKLIAHEKVDKALTSNPYFWTNAENTTDYNNRWCAIHKAFGMPMLDYNNWDLQDLMIKFLSELREYGVLGLRVDMGKHFALEEEGSLFWKRVFGGFSDMFNYAECLECDKSLLDKYTKFINVITDYHMPSDRSKAVIFIMSHDTEETWGFTKKMKDSDIIREWEILLRENRESHILFYVRPFSNLYKSDKIREINCKYK